MALDLDLSIGNAVMKEVKGSGRIEVARTSSRQSKFCYSNFLEAQKLYKAILNLTKIRLIKPAKNDSSFP